MLMPAGVPPFPVSRFTVDEYHRLAEIGVLTEDDDVELLEGWIVPKMARNPPHDTSLELADEAIGGLLPPGWRRRIQSAVTLPDSEPEPDIAVVRGDARSRAGRHPGPGDAGLLIEVADASLAHDRQDKGRVYANAGIVCYWIINLVDRQVEVYTDPTGPDADPRFRQRHDYGVNDTVPLVIEGREVGRIAVRELLP
jgi:Uma2 family endonuclease